VSPSGRGISLLSALLACGAIIGPVATAQASDATIRATLKSAHPTMQKDQVKVQDGIAIYEKRHSSTALIKALNRQATDLHALQGKLSGQSASSTKGAKGKADIVKGLGLVAKSDTGLAKALRAAHGKPVPRSQLTTAVATAKKGNRDLAAGMKLLR
jgi:hypothetical protein